MRTDPYLDAPFTLKKLSFNTGAQSFIVDGSTLTVAGVNNNTIAIHNQSTRSQTIQAAIQLAGSAIFRAQSGDLHFNAIDLNDQGLVFQADSGRTVYLDGVISDSQGNTSRLVEFTGNGTFVVKQTNTYKDRTRIRQGTVEVQSDGAFGTGPAMHLGGGGPTNATVKLLTDGAVTVNREINVNYVSGNSYTIGGKSADLSAYSQRIQLDNNVTLNLTAAVGGRVNFNGSLTKSSANVGSVVKVGDGIAALSNGSNDYTGTTEVSEGTLLFNGALNGAGGAVTVKSGATLGGGGMINRAVTVEDGGILSAGDMDAEGESLGGLLTINGNLTFSNSSVLLFDLGSEVSLTNDRITVLGDLTLDGVLSINALSGFGEGVYTLFNFSGGTFNDHGLTFDALPGGFSYAVDSIETPGQIRLIVTTVPEPGSIALLIGGLFGLAGWSRCRRRA